jgi:Cof subfamily protein (haloacid dehalogenase superfamily)
LIELIVIDIDGTLLNSDLEIGEKSLKAIGEARNRGVKITFATGRQIAACRRYAEQLGIDIPIIALNGSVLKGIYDSEMIERNPLPDNVVQEILPLLKDTKATVIAINSDHTMAWNLTEKMKIPFSSWLYDISEIKPDELEYPLDWIMVAGSENDVRSTACAIEALKIEKINVYTWASIRHKPLWYMEIRAKGTNKGTALYKLKKMLGISTVNTLVIGDYLNDLSMVKEAGVFAAVSNAHDEVRKVAHHVSDSSCDNDAVAEIINKFVLAKQVEEQNARIV